MNFASDGYAPRSCCGLVQTLRQEARSGTSHAQVDREAAKLASKARMRNIKERRRGGSGMEEMEQWSSGARVEAKESDFHPEPAASQQRVLCYPRTGMEAMPS